MAAFQLNSRGAVLHGIAMFSSEVSKNFGSFAVKLSPMDIAENAIVIFQTAKERFF